jgi:hypothetical protein
MSKEKWIQKLFQELESANDIFQLQEVAGKYHWRAALSALDKKYPRLPFRFTMRDLQRLKESGIIDETCKLNMASIQFDDPLLKLLWGLAWKNGDLLKLQHILDGISGQENTVSTQNLIFKQFGKSLMNEEEPIIDQHVLRAFCCAKQADKFDEYVKKTVYKNKDVDLIRQYIVWFKGQLNKIAPENTHSYGTYLDKLLLLAGKELKKQNGGW